MMSEITSRMVVVWFGSGWVGFFGGSSFSFCVCLLLWLFCERRVSWEKSKRFILVSRYCIYCIPREEAKASKNDLSKKPSDIREKREKRGESG